MLVITSQSINLHHNREISRYLPTYIIMIRTTGGWFQSGEVYGLSTDDTMKSDGPIKLGQAGRTDA